MRIKTRLLVLLCVYLRSAGGEEDTWHEEEGPAIGQGRRLQRAYDFVVVGAGPAGSVVASRLSEDPNVSVLLVEAGPEDDTVLLAKVPLAHLLMFYSDFNWKYRAKHDPSVCRSMYEQTCAWPSGRGLGGGTNLNGMIYTRGNKVDFDRWAELGNEGWSYEELLPHFIKLEGLAVQELNDTRYRGTAGPVHVGLLPYESLGSKVFRQAGKELGYPLIDYNKPYRQGFGAMQATIKDGRRYNAVSAYLQPIRYRKNLHVLTDALVTRVIIEPRTNSAQGVLLRHDSQVHKVWARREVILSAGAFGSPKLLMLSGVGPINHLQSLGIPVFRDLPVGNNLQEHPGSTFLVFLSAHKNFTFIPYQYTDSRVLSVVTDYFLKRKGPFTSPGAESLAYLRSKYAEDEHPDVEILFVGFSYDMDFGSVIRDTVGIRRDVYEKYWLRLQGGNTFTMGITACYPRSRGTVRLASANPDVDPVIENNFFSNLTDLKVVVQGMKMAIKIASTKIMKDYGVKVYKRPQPGCEHLKYGTDEYFECSVRQATHQWHHPCGTCKMGPDSDPSAVVDPRLRVRGVSRLRVVDSSIMPLIPAGHIQAASYMIGEKGAAMIKEDHRLWTV